MLQFYFLSILCNTLTGLTLVFMDEDGVPDGKAAVGWLFRNAIFHLITGILTVLVGVLKILPGIQANHVFLFGDFLPVAAGLAGGFAVLLGAYRASASADVPLSPAVSRVFVQGKKYIGIGCIVVSVLHFIFPHVLFL